MSIYDENNQTETEGLNLNQSQIYLIKWLILAIIGGAMGSSLVHLFSILLSKANLFFVSHQEIPIVIWPVIGAVIAGTTIYKIAPHAAGEGIPSYIIGMNKLDGKLPVRATIFKYFAALITLSTFGNGGVVGPLGRVSAGVTSLFCEHLPGLFKKEDFRTASICGMAGAIGAIFHSSIGAGIFAIEIMQREKLGYKDIFPAIMSSTLAVFTCKVAGWDAFYTFNVPNKFMDVKMIGALLILTLLAGFLGGFFVNLYIFTSKIFKRKKETSSIIKLIIGSLFAGGIAWSLNPELMGTSSNIWPNLINFNSEALAGRFGASIPIATVLIMSIFVKMFCNCLTVGSGMSAGFTGPAAISGMLLGAAIALLFGIEPGSATYYAFIAAGFCGVLSGSMNIPLAAAIMTIEIFGLQYSLAAGLSAVIAFQTNRHIDIYDYALRETTEKRAKEKKAKGK